MDESAPSSSSSQHLNSMTSGYMDMKFTVMKNKHSDSRNRCSAVTVNFNKACLRTVLKDKHVLAAVRGEKKSSGKMSAAVKLCTLKYLYTLAVHDMCVMMWDAAVHSIHLFV